MSNTTVILVCLINFQNYIINNIEQLIRLKHKKIVIIISENLLSNFDCVKDNIELITTNNLEDTYNFYDNTTLDKTFRSGFWTLTSERFFYIYEYMKKYNVKDVIHLENDVLLYYNCDILINSFNNNYMYLPFDTYKRNIASIMYIPNHDIFKIILDNYQFNLNDMENFSIIKQKTNLIDNFPIFINYEDQNDEIKFVSKNYNIFNFIFDAAAIGQYLGGIDPRNCADNTIGFINETCIIKYNDYKFLWINIDGIRKPFIIINDVKIPIFNLHIHCKNLEKFI
jgi:hypothetical protein